MKILSLVLVLQLIAIGITCAACGQVNPSQSGSSADATGAIDISADSAYVAHMEFVEEQRISFLNPDESPLTDADKGRFEFVNYYPYDIRYRVLATLKRTPDDAPFEMATSTERKPVYRRYGILYFTIKGEELALSVYQNLELSATEGYENHLFLPYNDLSNGVTSYGGGRYLDMRVTDSDQVYIDFNNSYHPYCAYNHRYSCPIPPDVNVLDIAIEAGVKSGINGESGEH